MAMLATEVLDMRVMMLFLAGFFIGMSSSSAAIELANSIGTSVSYALYH